jgi:hypothetical protein
LDNAWAEVVTADGTVLGADGTVFDTEDPRLAPQPAANETKRATIKAVITAVAGHGPWVQGSRDLGDRSDPACIVPRSAVCGAGIVSWALVGLGGVQAHANPDDPACRPRLRS